MKVILKINTRVSTLVNELSKDKLPQCGASDVNTYLFIARRGNRRRLVIREVKSEFAGLSFNLFYLSGPG